MLLPLVSLHRFPNPFLYDHELTPYFLRVGMLKKRKKAKASPPPDGKDATPSSALSSSKEISAVEGPSNAAVGDRASGSSTDVTEKVLDSPLTAPVAAVASVSLAAIGA